MADYTVTAASVVQSSKITPKSGTAGASIAAGDVLYKDDSGLLQLGDANVTTKTTVAGIAVNSAASGQKVLYVDRDDDFTPGFTGAIGDVVCLSATAGKMAPHADLTTGDEVVILGVMKTTTKMNLCVNPLISAGDVIA